MAKRSKQRVERLLDENNGVLTVSKVIGSGIPRPGVYDFARSCGLEEPLASSWAPTSFLTSSTCSRRATPRSCSRTRCPLTSTIWRSVWSSPSLSRLSRATTASLKDQGVRIFYAKPEWCDLGISKEWLSGGHVVRGR